VFEGVETDVVGGITDDEVPFEFGTDGGGGGFGAVEGEFAWVRGELRSLVALRRI
jgi:hypothetical protein